MMQTMLLLALAACLSQAHPHPVNQRVVDEINKADVGWSAANPEDNQFANMPLNDIVGLMGLTENVPIAKASPRLGAIPTAFDARTKWPSCKKPIRNQAKCGSCWAFGAAETLTDNLCVLGKNAPVLSPQDLVSCDKTDHGCHGGSLLNVWTYIDKNGLTSDACIPYTSGDGSNATCPAGCSAGGSDTKYKCPKAHKMIDSDSEIQAAVMTTGAVEVGFTVYGDFMNYKKGVYSHKSGLALGGHAVKIVGWGEDFVEGNQTFYWIVQNSWGPTWGEEGYFRIKNWHDDKDSAIAIGGGFACVDGAEPSPPGPPPPPVQCKDIVSYCAKEAPTHDACKKKSYLIPVCKKTCGCCDSMKPSYCPK